MLPRQMTAQSAVRKRYPKVTDHGTQVVDYSGVPAELPIKGSFQPGPGIVDQQNRDGAQIAYTVFAPIQDIVHDDLITFNGRDYQIDGEPERWEVGMLNHMVIKLTTWKG